MPPQLPEKPKLSTQITGIQKILAGISGSMFLMALVTLIPFVANLFAAGPLFLSTLRMAMAAVSLVFGGLVGIPQIGLFIKWIIDFYEFYRKFKSLKPPEE